LVPDPRAGKQKRCIRNTKPYNISASVRKEKHTKYVMLDCSITLRK